jgi:hypothetical protein
MAMAVPLPCGGVFRYVALDQIRRRPDARPLNDDAVSSLAESILDVGLRNPINVRLIGDIYELVAGSHRLAAFARLGEREIPVQEIDDDDLHAELAMIDENLCRAELSPADKARQTARRKVIYEALHPDTRHGSPGVSRQVGDTRERTDTDRFTADTAARTGQSERTVQRNVERGEKIIDAVVDLVRGTRLDTGTYLDELRKLSPNDQITAVRRDLVRGSADHHDSPRRLADGECNCRALMPSPDARRAASLGRPLAGAGIDSI